MIRENQNKKKRAFEINRSFRVSGRENRKKKRKIRKGQQEEKKNRGRLRNSKTITTTREETD